MKAKVIIENLESNIELTPENKFEKRLLEDMYDMRNKYNIHTTIDSIYSYGVTDRHKIYINIKETE
jgi:hypothetical protein